MEEQPGDYTTAKSKEVMEQFLAAYRDQIRVVYCENDNMAYGAIEVLEEQGYTVGMDPGAGDVLVLSFDATKDGLLMTHEGMIAVNTECSPLYGPKLVEMIDALERGEEVPKRTIIEEAQFSSYDRLPSVRINRLVYPVTRLTEEIMGEREY